MNDLEICKRIAEIENEHITEVICSDGNWLCAEYCEEYNPLTDDALCFKLMVKYKVDVIQFSTKLNARIYADPEDEPISNVTDKNPNKAICLAIIEANNE